MKAKSIILATVLTITTSILFAENDNVSNSVSNENASVTLAPSMPLEADFNDVPPVENFDFVNLAPEVPGEADFSDALPAEIIDMTNLVPTVPGEADFNDSVDMTIDISTLAPSTPFVAEFE